MHFGLQSQSQVLATAKDGIPSFAFAWALIISAWCVWKAGEFIGLWRCIFWLLGKIDDVVLARGLSFLTGTYWKALGKRWADRLAWAQLICLSAIVAAAVATLPLDWAIGAMGLGLLIILGVLRDWSKSEREREELAALGVHRNLLWEAVFAASLLFLIAPMGFSRIDLALKIFPNPRGSIIVDLFRTYLGRSAGFTWGEVPHSIPIIHAFAPDGNPFSAGGKKEVEAWAAALRLVYELMVVAVFVDALRIGQRIAAQADLRPLQKDVTLGAPLQQRRAIAKLSKLALEGRRDASDLLEAATAIDSEVGHRPFDVRLEAISALYGAAARFGRRTELFVVIDRLQGLIREIDEEHQADAWTATHTLLAMAWQSLADIVGGEVGQAYLHSALQALDAAKRGFSSAAPSSAFADIQAKYAGVFTRLGDLSDGGARAGYLRQAVQALEVALAIYRSDNDRRRAGRLKAEITGLLVRLGRDGAPPR